MFEVYAHIHFQLHESVRYLRESSDLHVRGYAEEVLISLRRHTIAHSR